MSIINKTLLLGSGDEGYNLTRSLRFRASASAYLSRTPASAGNRKTWTYSFWVKRGLLSNSEMNYLLMAGGSGNETVIAFTSNADPLVGNADTLSFYQYTGGFVWQKTTSQLFRDVAAWYHIVAVFDTDNATAEDRARIYVNGARVTNWQISTNPSSGFSTGMVNSTSSHEIARANFATRRFDGYLTEVNFIDGQALTPSSFGETDTITGVWKPKRYAGTYGTNGFYLPFTDNSALTTSSNAGLGKDFSGNGNYWTTNNISITSGVTYDSMTDVPTLTSATVANYCVLNPINKSPSSTVSNGNLRQTPSGGWYRAYSTIFFASTAAFYAEATMTSLNSGSNGVRVGVANANSVYTYLGSDANSWSYDNQGNKYTNGSLSSYGASYVQGDVIGILFNNGSLTFYKNGVSQGVAYSGLTGTFCFAGSPFDTDTVDWNFGQRPFAYSVPSGALALNTFNLPNSTIVKGNTVMDATLWTGNSTSPRSITNAATFQPDLVWIKSRSNNEWNILFDSVRGTGKSIYSNSTNAEVTNAGSGYVSAFNSNGFSVTGGSTDSANVNQNTYTYVGWQWQAGQGTTSTNTSGSITSTVSVNATAGFSAVRYTGTGSAATIGHGLGVAPAMYIVKRRNGAIDWGVYHSSLTSPAYALYLDTTNAQFSAPTYWNSTAPTSSVFSIGTDSLVNASGGTYVAYCWTPIAGYSAFGSYTGNGSTDGPFIYTGFRPKFVMVKVTSTTNWWIMFDSTRNPYNAANYELAANLSDAEYTATTSAYTLFDFLSNGFKLRTGSLEGNSSGQSYLYVAFAENPFKNALAR